MEKYNKVLKNKIKCIFNEKIKITNKTSISLEKYIFLYYTLQILNLEIYLILQQSVFKMFFMDLLVLNCLFQMI